MRRLRAAALAFVLGCSGGDALLDAGIEPGRDAGLEPGRDAGLEPGREGGADAAGTADAAAPADAPHRDAAPDGAAGVETLAEARDRLLASLGDPPCEAWAALGPSQRAVFLTITHRLWISHTPDGRPALSHLTRLYAVLGGGERGDSCGGIANNRLFLAMDAYLWERMVETWEGAGAIGDGGGSTWIRTRDFAGPHEPFDASIETDTGLRCSFFLETAQSRPPTAQAHFFLTGSAVAFERGSASLPADPYMLEVDQDYDCLHDSNPLCRDFDERYASNYGDFECDWVPSACRAVGEGCYRPAE